ncbi:MAG: hypothetical protein V3T77_01345 [Planctomycetota bacterium]
MAALFRTRPAWLFWGAFLFFVAFSRGYISNIDVQIRYLVANQIWHHGTVHPTEEQFDGAVGATLAQGKDGRRISSYGLGQSLTMLPAVVAADLASRVLIAPENRAEFQYRTGQFLYKTLILPLLSALALLAFTTLAVRLGLTPPVAVWSAFTLGFATYWLFYTKTIGMGVELAGWLLWALVAFTSSVPRIPALLLTSLFLGIPFLYRQEMLIPVAVGFVILLFKERRNHGLSLKSCTAFLVPITLCGLAALWHNHARTGSLFSAGYGDAFTQAGHTLFADYPGKYLLQLFFGATKGFFWFSPILLVSLGLLLPGPRRWHPALTLAALPVLAFVFFVSSLHNAPTVGGWGMRFLVPITPFAVLAVAILFSKRLEGAGTRRTLLALVLINVGFQGVLGFADHNAVQMQTERTDEILASRGAPPLAGWQSSRLAGKLRNLGIPLGERALVTEIWNSDEIQAYGTTFGQNLWWLKVAQLSGSRVVAVGCYGVGIALTLASLFALALALWGSSVPRTVPAVPENRVAHPIPAASRQPS